MKVEYRAEVDAPEVRNPSLAGTVVVDHFISPAGNVAQSRGADQ